MIQIPRTLIVHYPVRLPGGEIQDNTITYVAVDTGEVDVVETTAHQFRSLPVIPQYRYRGGFRERIN